MKITCHLKNNANKDFSYRQNAYWLHKTVICVHVDQQILNRLKLLKIFLQKVLNW